MEDAVRVVRGAVTIPAKVRRQLGLEEGTLVGLEVQESSVVIRRARIIAAEEPSASAAGNGRKPVMEGA
jgi:AbrB family looped-hinge helix DNA binding protein